MKKLCSIKVLCSFVVALIFLLTTMVSMADNYVLNFKTSQTHVKVYLSIDPETNTDGAPEEQATATGMSPDDVSGSHEHKTVGGLPISGPPPSVQSQPRDLTSIGSDGDREPETVDGIIQGLLSDLTMVEHAIDQELGATGGPPVSPQTQPLDLRSTGIDLDQQPGAVRRWPASSPVSVTIIDSIDAADSTSAAQPLTNQPDDASVHSVHYLKTGSSIVYAWLERGEVSGGNRFHISANELKAFVRMFASLVAMKVNKMRSWKPFPRFSTYVFNSEANPTWSCGKFAVLSTFLAVAAGTGTGFGTGVSGLAYGSLVAGGVFTPLCTCFFSHTRFPNPFQVSFTFSSNQLLISQEIYDFQQIVNILQCSGGYELVSFSLDEQNASQTLTFNVRVPDNVDAKQFQNWLESKNQQLANPFQIKVSSMGKSETTL